MKDTTTITENPRQAQSGEPQETLIGVAVQPFSSSSPGITLQVILMDLLHQTLLAAGVCNRQSGAMTSPHGIVILIQSPDRCAVLNTLAEFIQGRWCGFGVWEMAWHDPAEYVWRSVISQATLPFERHFTNERLQSAVELTRAYLEVMNKFRAGLGLPPIEPPSFKSAS